MKLSYTIEDIEQWRDRVHRRLPHRAVRTKHQAIQFISEVGFCFAFRAEDSELPCLWDAACGQRRPVQPMRNHLDPSGSFIREMKRVLPLEGKAFYGNVFRRRPTIISTEFFPHFYALSQRTGSDEDYLNEYKNGKLSVTGKMIMEVLSDVSPQSTRALRTAVGNRFRSSQREFDKGMIELQTKFHIVGAARSSSPLMFEWNTVDNAFPRLVRRARNISPSMARRVILQKYFENQLIGSVRTIHHLFGWKKQVIYEVLGHLVKDGIITGSVTLDGDGSAHYCLVA